MTGSHTGARTRGTGRWKEIEHSHNSAESPHLSAGGEGEGGVGNGAHCFSFNRTEAGLCLVLWLGAFRCIGMVLALLQANLSVYSFGHFYFFFLLGSSRFPAGLLATAMFPELPAERISTPPAPPTEGVTRRRRHQGGLDLGTCNSAEARASRRACMHTHEKCPPAQDLSPQDLSRQAPCLRCPCLDALAWHQVSC